MERMNRTNGRLMQKIIALFLSLMIILPCLPIKGAGAVNANIFSDISASWAKNEIEYFAGRGWIKGYPDGTFGPEKNITRAEFTAIINNVFNYTEAVDQCTFPDVYATDWYYQVVLIASKQGYIKGYPDQTFRPNANISRYEAAVILARLLNMDNGEYKSEIQHFTDAQDIPEWAGGGVGALTAHKIIGGYPDGRFAGANFITRAETVVLIKRAHNHNIAANPAEDESSSREKGEGDSGSSAEDPNPLSINWADNVQSSMTEFVAGAEVELEITCDEEAEISWSVTQGDLLGKLTDNKVWWRLPDKAGQYTVTVTVKDGRKSKSLSRMIKVIPYTPSGDAIADITALNGGIAPIMSYDTTVGIPSMIIGRYSPKKIYTAEDAIDSLNDIKELMNMENPQEEFKLLKTEKRNNTSSYILSQVYKGIPVYGGHIVIEADSNLDIFSVNGSYYPDVRLSGLSVVPAVDKSEAQAIVENNLAAMGNHPEASPEFVSTFLIVDMVHSENPELVWEIRANIGGETWKYFVHAQSGKVIDKFLMSPLYYNGDGVNTTSTLRSGEKINVVKVKDILLYKYVLYDWKRNIQIFDMKNQGFKINFSEMIFEIIINPTPAWPGEVIEDFNEDFRESHSDALVAAVNFSKVYDFFFNTLGRKSIDGDGKKIDISVNIGVGSFEGFDYAFWRQDKEQIGIGNKGNKVRAVDVLVHEYTHGIAYYSVKNRNDEYNGFDYTNYSESAAISEAISDIFGALVEASIKGYSVGDANFYKCAEDSAEVIRDMSAAKVNHLSKFVKTGKPGNANYGNSGILSTAFYKMTSDPDGIKDIELLANVWYDTLLKLKPDATFKICREEFCKSIYKYQHDVKSNGQKYSISNEQIEAVKKAFDGVGITDDVKDTAWYAAVIKKAKDKKIIFGYTDGNIRPEKTVTRAEFLVMAMRASKITVPREQLIDERLTNHWAGAEVTFAKQEKWISDCWLDPAYIEKPITRTEACNLAFWIMNANYEYTKVYRYEYVNGQRSEKGETWEQERFHDFTSGLDIVPRDDRTQLIKAVQERLNWQGNQLKADGLYGEDTIKALRSFQKKAGLIQTGMIDDITWEALNYFGMYQLFINGCFEGSFDDKVLYLAPWRNLSRAEACKILISPLN